jgi:hypothetical protein
MWRGHVTCFPQENWPASRVTRHSVRRRRGRSARCPAIRRVESHLICFGMPFALGRDNVSNSGSRKKPNVFGPEGVETMIERIHLGRNA